MKAVVVIMCAVCDFMRKNAPLGPGPEAEFASTQVSDYTALLNGLNWSGLGVSGRPTIITYSFESSAQSVLRTLGGESTTFLNTFQTFTQEQRNTAVNALNQWANASGLVFLEVPATLGEIRFGAYDTNYSNSGLVGGYAYYPYVTLAHGANNFQSDIGGEIVIDKNSGFDFVLLAHEIGHAIGLKHTFSGTPVLTSSLDNYTHTVMSYTYGPNSGALGEIDTAAAAYLYGPNGTGVESAGRYYWNAANLTLVQYGTSEAESIRGIGVNDIIYAGNGNDLVVGYTGSNFLSGEGGHDSLTGGSGSDTLSGGSGYNYLYGSDGTDIAILSMNIAASAVSSGPTGVKYVSNIASGEFDTLQNVEVYQFTDYYGAYVAPIYTARNGTAASEVVNGAATADQMYAGDGNDSLYGLDGADQMYGGNGIDILVMGTGNDAGMGNAGNDYVYSGAGDDVAGGGPGIDVLLGEIGNDSLYGGDDQDYLYAGDGNDFLSGDGGVDVLIGEGGNDSMEGGAGGDYFYGGVGDDSGAGADGNDIFVMDSGSDFAVGENGQDYFYMGEGNDTMLGGAGVDVLLGEGGNDFFEGGTDVDYFFLGSGIDTVLVNGGTGAKVVNDFTAGGGDLIRLVGWGFTSYSDVLANIYDAGSLTIISQSGGSASVWLNGVSPSQLTGAEFSFV